MDDAEQAALDEVWTKFEEGREALAEQPTKYDWNQIALRGTSSDEVTEEAAGSTDEVTEDAPKTDERPRGPDGKFAKAGDEKQPEAEAEEKEPTQEAVAPPSLPKPLQEEWKNLSETGREALKASYDEMSGKLGQAVREQKAVRPIYDQVVKAAGEFPAMKDLTPQQIGDQVFGLARMMNSLRDDPVAMLDKMASDFGVKEALSQTLAGQQPTDTANLVREVADLKQKLAQATDPNRIQELLSQHTAQSSIEAEVMTFSRSKDDWQDVEAHMPQFVSVASQIKGDGAAPADVLEAAYDMAVNSLPHLRERQAQRAQDAERQKAAAAARDANIRSAAPAGSVPMTDQQLMQQVWDNHYG